MKLNNFYGLNFSSRSVYLLVGFAYHRLMGYQGLWLRKVKELHRKISYPITIATTKRPANVTATPISEARMALQIVYAAPTAAK